MSHMKHRIRSFEQQLPSSVTDAISDSVSSADHLGTIPDFGGHSANLLGVPSRMWTKKDSMA